MVSSRLFFFARSEDDLLRHHLREQHSHFGARGSGVNKEYRLLSAVMISNRYDRNQNRRMSFTIPSLRSASRRAEPTQQGIRDLNLLRPGLVRARVHMIASSA